MTAPRRTSGHGRLARTLTALLAAWLIAIAPSVGPGARASTGPAAPAPAPAPARAPAPAPAQETSTVDADTKILKDLYEEAHVSFLAGRYTEAAGRFDEGFRRSQLPAFLFNSAVAWERAGNLEQAVDRFAKYLVKLPDADDHDEVERRLETLRNAIKGQNSARVTAVKTKGVAIISSKPDKAEIRLDDPNGKIFAYTPFRGTLPPGEHVVHIAAKGYKPDSKALPDNEEKMLIAHFSLSEEYFLGHLEIRSPVAGADVFLKMLKDSEGKDVAPDSQSDAPVGRTPFSNQIAPGTWRVQVKKAGYTTVEREVVVQQGKIEAVNANLTPVVHVIVDLDPKNPDATGAEVLIDKKPTCTLPCDVNLPPGTHTFVIRKKGFKTLQFSATAAAAELIKAQIDLQPATRRTPAIVTGVLMAATGATGIGFGVRALQTRNQLRNAIDDGEQIADDDPRAKVGFRDAIIADAMFGATALLGALTIYYLVRETGTPSSALKEQRSLTDRVSVVPVLGPSSGGIVGEVRF